MRIRRWLKRFLVLGLLCLLGAFALHLFLRPAVFERAEIYRGVFLTVEDLPSSDDGSGRVMIVEVHWDTPGVRFGNRPFSFPVDPENPIAPHYKLAYADWELLFSDYSILVNTSIYMPDAFFTSLPGKEVRSNETVVADGRVSHIHPHSYLLYWDKSMDAHMLGHKPPDPDSLAQAVTGVSLQGIQVNEGRASYNAIASKEDLYSRTFVGVDPIRKILYLMAFENASGFLMIDRAVQAGVIFGGQVDSGRSTNLLIGKNAKGIRRHTGIRGPRPLGPYLTVSADPLE